MTEIEKTEGEIKVLQAKLELLKEMEKRRSPAEEAFKEVYGYYPEVCERSVWVPFQKGYEEAQKDYKVVEEPKPGTLYNVLRHGLECSIDMCDGVVDAVEGWLPDEIYIEFSGAARGAYERGWNDAIRTTKEKLR
jgi:hypothetical protein